MRIITVLYLFITVRPMSDLMFHVGLFMSCERNQQLPSNHCKSVGRFYCRSVDRVNPPLPLTSLLFQCGRRLHRGGMLHGHSCRPFGPCPGIFIQFAFDKANPWTNSVRENFKIQPTKLPMHEKLSEDCKKILKPLKS